MSILDDLSRGRMVLALPFNTGKDILQRNSRRGLHSGFLIEKLQEALALFQ